MRFVGILVDMFHMRPEDAWNCTVREFWYLLELHMERLGKKLDRRGPKFKSAQSVQDFEDHLKSIGAL